MKRTAALAAAVLVTACTGHKLTVARESAVKQMGCDELVIHERHSGWEATGCGQTHHSKSVDGPWTPMSCGEWSKLNHNDCVADERRNSSGCCDFANAAP